MMLKLNMKTPVGTFLVEGATHMDVFGMIANIQEVFSEQQCGLCKQTDVRYVVRDVGGNKFPEIHCQNPNCQARLSFGQNRGEKLGSLYPARKLDKNGKPNRKTGALGDHRGWSKFKGDVKTDED